MRNFIWKNKESTIYNYVGYIFIARALTASLIIYGALTGLRGNEQQEPDVKNHTSTVDAKVNNKKAISLEMAFQ